MILPGNSPTVSVFGVFSGSQLYVVLLGISALLVITSSAFGNSALCFTVTGFSGIGVTDSSASLTTLTLTGTSTLLSPTVTVTTPSLSLPEVEVSGVVFQL